MIVSIDRVRQPDVGTESHWQMLATLRQHPDLFDPLNDLIVVGVNEAIAASPNSPYIDSRQLGASVLNDLSSWWRAQFPRRFPQFPNGSERGIFGMALWLHLSTRSNEWWSFTSQPDSHGYGQPTMQYWRLPPGHPLIP